ncbi:16S rRNA (cytosine(967)-C(5))-methyltransferase RsmB [Pseudoxanthomonas sp.]|uniref:16S rRNA (cytosine(967)-C(5))-methyltransferase RsmB n=1 Tax=Pseudoxanthomonas sp. TaxID=1871049 RepID=UPI0025F32550|nr:16S rRNA (cytosine(967)-C(5))-methyltransferase RsmB [Pseudoxanthomonas sp.]
MTTQAGVAVRVIATRVVDAVMHRGRSLKAELAANLPRIEDARDRALLEAICFAALRSRMRGEAAIAAWMSKPPGPADSELRALLHVGFAQLVVMALPAHAALSATVEAVRALGRPHQDKLVNALLRRAQREGLPTVPADAAWPAWLRRHVRTDWPQQADAIFAASQCEAPLWLRVNRRHGTREAYRGRLQDAGIAAETADGVADALLLRAPIAATTLPGFAEGHVSVQDGAAQRVADLFHDLPAGARVLDLCAAPGGKSAHLLERDPSLQLVALDIDARRLQRVRETLERVGVSARLHAADGADPASWWDGQPFDAVLLDAPCSATGIVRRQPDVLLHRRAEDMVALTGLQARLLDAAWQVLRPGGRLVYATCSLLRMENAEQLASFRARHADAAMEALGDAWGRADDGGRQRLPGEQDMDGFFYAALRKA